MATYTRRSRGDGSHARARDELRLRKEIGARLRTARLGANVTLEGLAALLGNVVTFGALGHYESGRRPLPLPIAIALADILHVNAAELLGIEDADMSNDELRLMAAIRRLPLLDQQAYIERIEKHAKIFEQPLPDEPAKVRKPRRK